MNKTPESGSDDVIFLNRLATVVRVLSGTAHDVNNALQIIGGSAELLESQPGLAEPARRALTRIRSQAARAAGLIEDLSRFARDQPDVSSRLRFREVVVKAVGFRGWMIRRAGLSLTFDAAAAPPAEVIGKAGELLQAVINIIIDAERAFEQQKAGSITVTLTEEAGHAVLRTVHDGPERAPDQASERGLGNLAVLTSRTSALGLSAARLIAASHGGELTIDRSPAGEALTLRLPLARD